MTFFNRTTTTMAFHDHVHDGNAYSISSIFIGASSPVDILLDNSGNTKDLHSVFGAVVNLDAELRMFEEPIVVSNGTPLSVTQLNRTSSNVSGLNAYHSPTLSGAGSPVFNGTTLREIYMPVAGGSSDSSGGSQGLREGGEWVLPAGGKYLIRVTFVSTGNVAGDFTFYEREPFV